jgi:hypothetical protein
MKMKGVCLSLKRKKANGKGKRNGDKARKDTEHY